MQNSTNNAEVFALEERRMFLVESCPVPDKVRKLVRDTQRKLAAIPRHMLLGSETYLQPGADGKRKAAALRPAQPQNRFVGGGATGNCAGAVQHGLVVHALLRRGIAVDPDAVSGSGELSVSGTVGIAGQVYGAECQQRAALDQQQQHEAIKAWMCNIFTKEGAPDKCKMRIHMRRQRLWKHLRSEVKEWTLSNWERFEREQPDWFHAGLISQVDDDMIPPGSLEGRKRSREGSRSR